MTSLLVQYSLQLEDYFPEWDHSSTESIVKFIALVEKKIEALPCPLPILLVFDLRAVRGYRTLRIMAYDLSKNYELVFSCDLTLILLIVFSTKQGEAGLLSTQVAKLFMQSVTIEPELNYLMTHHQLDLLSDY